MSSSKFNLSIKYLKKQWRERLLGAVILGQGLFAVVVGSLIFYRAGAYFLDAGYYSYTLASENFTKQPPAIGDAWGSSLYATHMLITPLVITQFFRIFLDTPLNFIAFLGIQNLLLSIAGALLMMSALTFHNSRRTTVLWGGVLGAFCFPFTNIGLGSLLYPHVELIGTSLVAIAVLLFAIRWQGDGRRWIFVVAVVCLIFGLFAREDIGVHLGATVAGAVICSQWKTLGQKGFVRAAWLMAASVGAVAILMGYQRFFADSKGVFSLTYSGTPAYAHLTSVWYVLDRALKMLSSRLDLFIGLAAFTGCALLFRKREYLAFPLATAPWLLLNMTAIDPSKNAMRIYHLFPIILYATAPILSLAFSSTTKTTNKESSNNVRKDFLGFATYGVALGSLFLGGISAAPTGGGYLFTTILRYSPVTPSVISQTHQTIEDFAKIESGIVVDDAVMSIRPVDLQFAPLIPNVGDANDFDSALFFPTYQIGHKGLRIFLNGWIAGNREIVITCLPGGLVRADALPVADEPKEQLMKEKFDQALSCHPIPGK